MICPSSVILFYLTMLPTAEVLYSTGDTQINDWWNDIDRE